MNSVLVVNEIFYSIQGESSFRGLPCVFVRLTGCNMRCRYCDTKYSYYEGSRMSLDDIISKVEGFPCRLVEITGGEPLLQDKTPLLIKVLLEKGFEVLLETNGSIDISSVDSRCRRIVDIKCPSSGEHKKNNPDNFEKLTQQDEIKFVVADREDYLYARDFCTNSLKTSKVNRIHFSPVFGILPFEYLATWILEDGLSVSLALQLHKIVWPCDKRGV